MSFAERLASLPYSHPGTRCGVAVWEAKQNDADREAFNAALEDDTLTGADIHRVIKDMGFPHGQTSLRAHRQRVCLCRSQNA